MPKTLFAPVVGLLLAFSSQGRGVESPTAAEGSGLSIHLFAAEPDIVTPVNLTIDDRGRLLVIESHTHFPPEGYTGPKTDRIRLVQDTDGDGKADAFSTFYEGSVATMDIQAHGGWVYVATRNEVFRLRDAEGDGVAERREHLAKLDTEDTYPHNALGGLAFDADGRLYFGMGENHGFSYVLTGSDGVRLTGEGEGGFIFRMTGEGKGLERIARGIWNPFGVCVDRTGRVFAVDNDPHSRPPCRLLHIVPGGHYGFEYRHGGYGTSPLIAWNGELPGTLGMVSGTGEAPCEVMVAPAHAVPADMVDDLLVTSWGGHRVERYSLTPRGATFTARRQDLIVGGENFRPVGMVAAPDGSIYISDWVDRSYTLHGKGRIWRVRFDQPAGATNPVLPLTVEEQRAEGLRSGEASTDTLLQAMADADPWILQAVVQGLSARHDLSKLDWAQLEDANHRLGVVLALWQKGEAGGRAAIPPALGDHDLRVRTAAVRWVADLNLKEHRDAVEAAMDHPRCTAQFFSMCIAALDGFDRSLADYNKPTATRQQELLLKIVRDASRPEALRVLALRSLPPVAASWDELGSWLGPSRPTLALETLRTLIDRTEPARFQLFARIAADAERPPVIRAEAVMALSEVAEDHRALLSELANDANPGVSAEARRALVPGPPSISDRPGVEDTDGWLKLLEGPGDLQAGRRVFFHPKLGGCFRCHRMDGRGAPIGPDLTLLRERGDRWAALESILQPSKEVAPQYYTWNVTTLDGRSIVGFQAHENNATDALIYLDLAGQATEVRSKDIATRSALPVSLMPQGLGDRLTDQELRDLLAYLTSGG